MAKKKSSNKQADKVIKNYLNLFYMSPKAFKAKDIGVVLSEDKNKKFEHWEDMNVLEMELSSGNTIDFEPMKPDFEDPSDKSFIKNRMIQTIFAVTVCEDDIEEVKLHFEGIIEKLEGFLCTDSEDFKPFYVGGK